MEPDARFADFVAQRGDALLRYAYVLAGDPHDAADLVQEALLKLRASWSKVRHKDNPESYARTTISRLHIAVWRRRRRELPIGQVPDREHHDALPTGVDDTLWRLLAALPRRQRAVLVLRYYEQLTDEEIAGVLGVSRGTVRSQASRALDKLRAAVPASERSTP
ncbi:SigE family RNA polymerase sigma factor [Thermoactinospora rubra]|uniref:SigE family RNA polymerase sigma factor n=1 Tax=Thermoactinospora rubra TaxID=1088767 RepID=UPI000A0F755C|nr:SigE family RNA polymerase sigma factor [Thermoactinospora rubra]